MACLFLYISKVKTKNQTTKLLDYWMKQKKKIEDWMIRLGKILIKVPLMACYFYMFFSFISSCQISNLIKKNMYIKTHISFFTRYLLTQFHKLYKFEYELTIKL